MFILKYPDLYTFSDSRRVNFFFPRRRSHGPSRSRDSYAAIHPSLPPLLEGLRLGLGGMDPMYRIPLSTLLVEIRQRR